MRKLIATGFKGQLHQLGVTSLAKYEAHDRDIANGKVVDHHQLTPVLESDPSFTPVEFPSSVDINIEVQNLYQSLIDSGKIQESPFGDLIEIIQLEDRYIVSSIARKDYHKPGLAADLGFMLHTNDDRLYLLTGVRREEPGKGKPAWFGGYRDITEVDGTHRFESGMFAAIREGLEEASIHFRHGNLELLATDYDADSILTRVGLINTYFDASVHYAGTIPTSDDDMPDGERLRNGQKRVHASSGYLCLVEFDWPQVPADYVGKLLNPGDDIEEIVVADVTQNVKQNVLGDLPDRLQFGIKHHNDFLGPMMGKAHEVIYGK